MNRDRIIILCSILAACIGLAGARMASAPMQALRMELKLIDDGQVARSLPPGIAWRQAALGSFRGIVVNVLWIRATKLKDQGKFHEAMQLAQWITQLQPKFEQVWIFHAWNMAYNISVATKTAEERWMWVKQGIELLRDQAIPLNPDSARLHKELSWIFLHKIGQNTDEKHWFYKKELAAEWHELLGPPPNIQGAGRSAAFVKWFEPIAEMDRLFTDPTLPHLATMDAETAFLASDEKIDKEAQKLKAILRALDPEDRNPRLDIRMLLRVATVIDRIDSVGNQFVRTFSRPEYLYEITDNHVKLGNWLVNKANVKERTAIIAFARARALRQHYHMDPQWMLALMKGEWFVGPEEKALARPVPLDWRHPCSHTIYWASIGVKRGRGAVNVDDFDVLNTDRQVLHALRSLSREGRLVYDPLMDYYDGLPEAAFINAYDSAVIRAYQRIKYEEEQHGDRSDAPITFLAGHENFLIESVQWVYYTGDITLARDLQRRLRERYSGTDEKRKAKYSLPLEQFVLAEVTHSFDDGYIYNMEAARAVLSSMIRRYLEFAVKNNQQEMATRFRLQIKQLYDHYQKTETPADSVTQRARVSLRPLPEMYYAEFENYLLSQPYPYVSHKSRVWRSLPPDLDWMKYQALQKLGPALTAMAAGDSRMFPIPPGYEEFLKQQKNPVKPPAGPTNNPPPNAPPVPANPGVSPPPATPPKTN